MGVDQIVGLGCAALSIGVLIGVYMAEADERQRRDLDEIEAHRKLRKALQ